MNTEDQIRYEPVKMDIGVQVSIPAVSNFNDESVRDSYSMAQNMSSKKYQTDYSQNADATAIINKLQENYYDTCQ